MSCNNMTDYEKYNDTTIGNRCELSWCSESLQCQSEYCQQAIDATSAGLCMEVKLLKYTGIAVIIFAALVLLFTLYVVISFYIEKKKFIAKLNAKSME